MAAWVVAGVQKRQDALALVIVHTHKPHEGHSGWRYQQACFEHVALKPVEQDHAAHDQQYEQGSAQIWLNDDKPARNKAHAKHAAKIFPAQGAAVARQQARHQNQHGKLGHF